MRTIGETARDSGLGVSALRFYDRAGVLVPARVDPATGYRWYEPGQVDEARLLSRLRRTGMPLADVRLVLAGWSGPDTGLVRQLLDAHLRRLERGLAEARGEFSTVRALLDRKENPMTSTRTAHAEAAVPADALAAALDAVRFAVGTDPELPALAGVLFDLEGETLHVVATDRYRMAVAQAGAAGYDGPRLQIVVPAPLADAMRALLAGGTTARLGVDGDRVSLEAGDRQTGGLCPGHDFPDYRRLVALPAGRCGVLDAAAVGTGDEPCALTVVDGVVTLGGSDPDRVTVNRSYLLDAASALSSDRLLLELGAPTAPVVIRRRDAATPYSLLMPIRQDA